MSCEVRIPAISTSWWSLFSAENLRPAPASMLHISRRFLSAMNRTFRLLSPERFGMQTEKKRGRRRSGARFYAKWTPPNWNSIFFSEEKRATEILTRKTSSNPSHMHIRDELLRYNYITVKMLRDSFFWVNTTRPFVGGRTITAIDWIWLN